VSSLELSNAWRPSAKAGAYLVIVLSGTVAALLTGRAEAAVISLPFALVLVLGLAQARPLELDAQVSCPSGPVVVGQEVSVTAEPGAKGAVESLELFLRPGPGLAPPGTKPSRPAGMALVVVPGEATGRSAPEVAGAFAVRVVPSRWGNLEVGRLVFRARSLFGLLEAEGLSGPVGLLTVLPSPQPLRGLVLPRDAMLAAGAHVSKVKGPGPELAGVRPYFSGDRAKDVNWRAVARHGTLLTNERYPERGADVAIFLDTFDSSVLDRAVTAACSLAAAYLAQRDRLALVKFGGSLSWVRPGTGPRQLQLVMSNLVATKPLPSALYRGADLLPPRLLPASTLVVALSALGLDEPVGALVDMSRRGFDLVVIELPPPAAPLGEMGEAGVLAFRLWQLRRRARRDGLRSLGVPTVEWPDGRPLAEAVEEVGAWSRRRAR